jgi:type I restriction-modification system DNA methylase subunit
VESSEYKHVVLSLIFLKFASDKFADREQELIDEGLPVLEPYLGSTVKVRESHQRALPLIHLEPSHKLAQEFVALHDAIVGLRDAV